MSEYLDLEAELSDDEFLDAFGNKVERSYDDDENILEETKEDRDFIDNSAEEGDPESVLFYSRLDNSAFDSSACQICGDRVEDAATCNNKKCGHWFCFICITNFSMVRFGVSDHWRGHSIVYFRLEG